MPNVWITIDMESLSSPASCVSKTFGSEILLFDFGDYIVQVYGK